VKRYCFDTSGVSAPHEALPEDIYESMWTKVIEIFNVGAIAVTKEIYDEMIHIPGAMGAWIKANKSAVLLEIGDEGWNSTAYVQNSSDMNTKHHQYISEYCGGSKRTVCLNDISIIALAKTLGVPLVSMEIRVAAQTDAKRRIPDVCDLEQVEHLTFNDFLRREKIKV
jgi:hypothetical protein